LKNILISGGGGAGSVEIWRMLKNKYNLYFCDQNVGLINNTIPHKIKFQVPPANSKNYLDYMGYLTKKLKIDIFVPAVDEEILEICSKKNNLKNVFCPRNKITLIFLDKYKTSIFLKQNNYDNLNTLIVKKKKDFPLLNKLIVKPRNGRGSSKIHTIYNYTQYKSYLNLYNLKSKDVIVQKFIDGVEFTIFVDCKNNGELKAIVPIKVLNKKGITLAGETNNDKMIINFVKKFNEKVKSYNSYNLQIIKKKNKIFVLEINPRISTTFIMTLKLGYDPFTEKVQKKIFIPKKKITLKRYWSNIFT
jgi:carbamoyl-phosphate synthase large subunit